jgi:hypothetical protein
VLGPEPSEGGSLEAVRDRGYLRCGVTPRPGFAEQVNGGWRGLDIDMCRAIAAGIFGKAGDQVVFIDLTGTSSDYFSLINNDVDVVAGALVSLHAGGQGLKPGDAYSFSPSYYYDEWGHAFAMTTTGRDPQWLDLVYWIVTTTFYAEEQGGGQEALGSMPLIQLFGGDFQSMLYDAVHAVGSYKDMYARNLERVLPRSGRNQLNSGAFRGPQQFPLVRDVHIH